MENKITEIIRTNGVGYNILNHLFKSSNIKKNYLTRIRREENFSDISGVENIKVLIELRLITTEKVGRKKYLKITEKGKNVMERLHNLQKRLENK